MKIIFKIFCLILFLIVSHKLLINNCEAQWQKCLSLSLRSVNSLVTNSNTIFAGVGNGYSLGCVYISTNNGVNFTQTSLNNYCITSLALAGNYIFAGTWGSGIFKSSNNGSSWMQCGLNNKCIHSLVSCGNSVFAGTSIDGIFLSYDLGSSWIETGFNYGGSIRELAVNNNCIFASREGYGVYMSVNSGGSWSIITPEYSTFFDNVNGIAANGSKIFIATYSYGVYLSTNYGASWTQAGLNNTMPLSLLIFGNNTFAGASSGFYLTTNNGSNWIYKIDGLGPYDTESLCIYNNYIFAGTDNGIFRRPLSELIGIKQISELVPTKYTISQNYPNPFNPTTNIRMDIPKTSDAKLIVFDILGKEIATLVNEKLQPGTYEVTWDGSQYPSGVYFYKLTAGDFKETKKMILIK